MPRGNSEGFRAENKFKVAKKVWSSWTLVGKHTFNKLFEAMTTNPEFYVHTEVVKKGMISSKEEWRVTAWNAAFMAASIVSRGERHILKDLTNKMKGN